VLDAEGIYKVASRLNGYSDILRTLITGVSTRAIAESAVKSGNDVFTIDYFGDSDQKQIVENYSLLRDFNLPFRAENLIEVSSRFDFDSLVYISNFENFPDLLDKLPQHVKIIGNSAQTLRKVRDWDVLRDFLTANNIPFPETLLPGEEEKVIGWKGWLLKPTNSGGGSRIKQWEGERLKANQIIQRYIKGVPASASFIADGLNSVVIGLSAQLIGLNELGAEGFTWCGNILPIPLSKPAYNFLLKKIEKYISLLSAHFKLKGMWHRFHNWR
jgi:predicted ATP-grasp superfamily ATP-dependent carboligase